MTYQFQKLTSEAYLVVVEGKSAGHVSRVEWPTQAGSLVRTSIKWEARQPHQELLNVTVGTLPCFDTRREAAQYLTDNVGSAR